MTNFSKGDVNRDLVVKEPRRTRGNGFQSDKFRSNEGTGKNWYTSAVMVWVTVPLTIYEEVR